MFSRIRFLLAAFDRREFSEQGLTMRLARYEATSAAVAEPPRNHTHIGPLPVLWSEP